MEEGVGLKRYTVSIEVESEPGAAARLRQLLPDLLNGAGYVTTSGTTTTETWVLRAQDDLRKEKPLRGEWGPGISGRGSKDQLP